MKKQTKLFLMGGGIFILGLSISLLRYGNLGTDPYTTMNLGISSYVGLRFGTLQLLINILLFIIVWKKKKQTIGIGTITNMVMVGYISDFFFSIILSIFPANPSMSIKVSVVIISVILACIGIAMYMESELGIAPYDAITNIIIDYSKGKIPFFFARMTIDTLGVLVGYLFGATVGAGTLLLAFTTGPIVQIIREKLIQKRLNNKAKVARVKI